jgi:PhzF family phenazine biosynthesis protein
MLYSYRIVNVFTQAEDRFSGNPLAVFEDARGMDDATMQKLALQFNLSETTFILPSDRGDARVRIFTPAYEMPFAGHPTLGTAYVVSAQHGQAAALKLDMQAGLIPVQRRERRWQLRANAPTARSAGLSQAALAALLGVPEPELAGEARWVNTGNEQLVVPLRSEQAVRALQVDATRLAQLDCVHGNPKVYAFAELGADRVLARFFFPKAKGQALLEDPATGSACANLGGYYVVSGAARPLSRIIAQGEYTGRPSTLYLDVDSGGAIFVSGEVLELGRGVIELQ